MGVAHPVSTNDGQPKSHGEAELPREGPLDKRRLGQAAVQAEGTESFREEDGLWLTLTERADLWRCTNQPLVVTPGPGSRPPKGKRSKGQMGGRSSGAAGRQQGNQEQQQYQRQQVDVEVEVQVDANIQK